MPLGSTTTITGVEPKVKDGKLVAGAQNPITVTTTVDRYEHLEPTPENLKLLDAPNIDAAAGQALDGEGAGGDPGLAAVDLLGGDFLPSAFQQGGMMVRMANGKGADEHAFRLLAQDRVPERARVPVPAYGMPGPRRQVDPVRHAELHEPAQGGDLTR